MKYANKLSNDELTKLFKMFTDGDAKIISVDIERYDDCIAIYGMISIPDDECEGERLEVDDNYVLTDYDVKVYNHSGSCTKDYRNFMYDKFGNEYAKDYLI